MYIQGESGGNSVIWEVIISGIIGKTLHIYTYTHTTGYELAISVPFDVCIQGDSEGNLVILEVIVSRIIGKTVYIYVSNSEWKMRYSCLKLQT